MPDTALRRTALFMLLGLACLAGCTADQVYGSTKALRVQECDKLTGREREECLAEAGKTYDEYEKERKRTTGGS